MTIENQNLHVQHESLHVYNYYRNFYHYFYLLENPDFYFAVAYFDHSKIN